MPVRVKHWTLTALRNQLLKIGCKVVHHAKRVVFQLAEVAIPRSLFALILRRIERLCAAPDAGTSMILRRSNLQPKIKPPAIGAPQIGETRQQIAQTFKDDVEEVNNLQKASGSYCGSAGGWGKLIDLGSRCSLAKVQLGNPG